MSWRKLTTSAWLSAWMIFGLVPGCNKRRVFYLQDRVSLNCFVKFIDFTFGCIKTNGSSAETSPPRAPKKSLTLTAYETIIPNASRFSGVESLHEDKSKKKIFFNVGSFPMKFLITLTKWLKLSCYPRVSIDRPRPRHVFQNCYATMEWGTWFFVSLSPVELDTLR